MTLDSRTVASRRITAGCLAITASRTYPVDNGKIVRVERQAAWLFGEIVSAARQVDLQERGSVERWFLSPKFNLLGGEDAPASEGGAR